MGTVAARVVEQRDVGLVRGVERRRRVACARVEGPGRSGRDEGLALRQTRDSLIRASLVRHAALPGGALLAMLVAPKLLPFV